MAEDNEALKVGISKIASDGVNRSGEAVGYHIKAYTGVIDKKTGKVLKKGLKQISQSKVNPNDKARNLKQQAGFAAEIKEAANYNADAAQKGSQSRKVRTDDIGQVNDPLRDFVKTDKNSNVIPNSGSQMKFVGSTPKDTIDTLKGKKFQKYFDNDIPIEVPKDKYDDIINEANEELEKLAKQLNDQTKKGNTEQIQKLKDKIGKIKKIKKNIRQSSVTEKDAMFAREHPKLSTAKSVSEVANKRSIQAAELAMGIQASVSIIQNSVSLVNGETDLEEAIKNAGKDIVKMGADVYGTTYASTVVSGIMKNSNSSVLQAASKTGLPTDMVLLAISTTKTVGKYFQGEITGQECFEQLGQDGVSMISSSMFAALGQMAIPIPIVGGIIGSMIGYALASASYGCLLSALNEAKLAKEERAIIESMCEEHIKLMKEYRMMVEKNINEYLTSHIEVFHEAFDGVKTSLKIGDVDGFISSANMITKKLGREVLFETQAECDQLMMNSDVIKL